MRDVKKQAGLGRKIISKKRRIDLTAGELDQLLGKIEKHPAGKLVLNDVFNAVCDAFCMGVAVGSRNS